MKRFCIEILNLFQHLFSNITLCATIKASIEPKVNELFNQLTLLIRIRNLLNLNNQWFGLEIDAQFVIIAVTDFYLLIVMH